MKTTRKGIETLLRMPVSEFEKFHAKTKILKPVRNINQKFWPKEWIEVFYKAYSRFEEIKLPKPTLSSGIGLKNALEERHSTRKFSDKSISSAKLSSLLYFSAGKSPNKKGFAERRFYPSGGGRYPLEVYIISQNTDIKKGIFHYYVNNNSLERLADYKKKDLNKIINLKWVNKAGCIIIITAIFKRHTVKYGNRGYRNILVEAGHMAQNFYVIANALNLGICGVGGYLDDQVNALLDVNGVDESVVYLLAVGERG